MIFFDERNDNMKIFVSFDFKSQDIKASTTLKELCGQLGIGYQAMSRKMKKTGIAYTLGYGILIKVVNLVKSETRGGVANFGKKLTDAAGFRGFRGDDGLLHDKPQKKRTLADDVFVPKQRVMGDGADAEYED